ncbi:MAG: hypothetical protein ACP6IS_05425 [Candidatus Asgardarchaeia archaeon]
MYKEVYEIWKKEKSTHELRPIQRNFFNRVISYINDVKKEIEIDQNEVLAEIRKKELYYIVAMVKDLILLRFKKLIKIIFEENDKPDFEELSDFELKISAHLLEISKIINEVLDSLDKGKKIFIDQKSEFEPINAERGESLLKEEKPEEEYEEIETEYVIVRMKENLPEITGIDLNRYGPFKRGDIVKMPKDNALTLINDKLAEPINLQNQQDDKKQTPQD